MMVTFFYASEKKNWRMLKKMYNVSYHMQLHFSVEWGYTARVYLDEYRVLQVAQCPASSGLPIT